VDIAAYPIQSRNGAKWSTVVVDDATNFVWAFTHSLKRQAASFLGAKIEFFQSAGNNIRKI
jgi:hypothetical protein